MPSCCDTCAADLDPHSARGKHAQPSFMEDIVTRHGLTWHRLGIVLLLLPQAVVAQSQRSLLIRTDQAVADSSWTAGFRRTFGSAAIADAVLLWPGAPVVQGQANVGRLLTVVQGVGNMTRAMTDQVADSIRLTWQPVGAELSLDSSLGATWGLTVSSSVRSDAPVIGRYIAVWNRDGGEWLLAALMLTDAPGSDNVPRVSDLPLELAPAVAQGSSGPFVVADLAFARLAADSGAAIAFERWAAPDAHTFAGGGLLVQGPVAIGRVVSGPATWKWHPVLAGASNDGSMGWTVGEADITTADGHSGPSKYLTVWKRVAPGEVRFLTDGGNGRPAGP